jgi:hypothetical protein
MIEAISRPVSRIRMLSQQEKLGAEVLNKSPFEKGGFRGILGGYLKLPCPFFQRG